MAKRLTNEVQEWIKQDAELYAIVCKSTGIKPSSLTTTLSRNSSSTLTQYDTIKLIADYKGVVPESLLEEIEDIVSNA